jgi:hypothetical protein
MRLLLGRGPSLDSGPLGLVVSSFRGIVAVLTGLDSPLLKAIRPGSFIHPPSRGNPTVGLRSLLFLVDPVLYKGSGPGLRARETASSCASRRLLLPATHHRLFFFGSLSFVGELDGLHIAPGVEDVSGGASVLCAVVQDYAPVTHLPQLAAHPCAARADAQHHIPPDPRLWCRLPA